MARASWKACSMSGDQTPSASLAPGVLGSDASVVLVGVCGREVFIDPLCGCGHSPAAILL